MAITSILNGLMLPPMLANANSATLGQVSSAASDGSKCAFVVQAPKTGNIRKVRWGVRTITTGATVDVRLETIDPATGHPSGTLWGTNTNGAQVVANGDDNVWFTTTLTADAAVTQGQELGVVIVVPSGFSGNLLTVWTLNSIANTSPPYQRAYNASITTWIGTSAGHPMLMLEYDDGSYAPIRGCFPAGDVTSTVMSTSTTPDVIGVRFRLPWPARVRGGWSTVDADGDLALRLVEASYNQGAGTGILASHAVDKDLRTGTALAPYIVDFASPVTLSRNVWYRWISEPTSGTSVTACYDITVPSAAGLDAWLGADWHLTTAKDPTGDGDWTNHNGSPARVPALMGLLVDGFDNAVSVGGVSRARFQTGM